MCVAHTFDEQQGNGLGSPAQWWQEQPQPFPRAVVLPRAIWSLFLTSTFSSSSLLLQEAEQTAWKTRRDLHVSAKIDWEEVQTSSHNSHNHPLTQKGKLLKNSDSTKHSRGFTGFCLQFPRGFFSLFLLGKLVPLIL